jgi:hypothetical protein
MASARLWNWYRISNCALAISTCEVFLICVSWRVSVLEHSDRHYGEMSLSLRALAHQDASLEPRERAA